MGRIAEAFDVLWYVAPVRLRGGNSRFTRHASGHVYLMLKDDKAVIEGAHRSGRPPQQSEIR